MKTHSGMVTIMKCHECGCLIFNYNEIMGETECNDCGLIVITEIFEETVRFVNNGEAIHSADVGKLGSIITGKGSFKFTKRGINSATPRHITAGLQTCNMILSSIQIDHPLKDRVSECYLEAQRKGLFGKIKLEARCTATVFYVLKENRTPVPMKALCSEYSCSTKVVNKIVRKMILQFKNKNLLYSPDPTYLLKQVTSRVSDDIMFYSNATEVLEMLEPIISQHEYNKTPAYYASICWLTANMFLSYGVSKNSITEKSNVSLSAIGKTTKQLLSFLNYSKMSDIKGKSINEIKNR